MIYFEYTKYRNEFLITHFEDGCDGDIKIRIKDHTCGSIQFGARNIMLENGVAYVPKSLITEGVHTPIFHSENGSFICDKIKHEAGKISPLINQRERIFELTEKLILADEKINLIENRVSELYSKISAKTIF